MAKNTGIAWTDHTWNSWQGCRKVSPGCANCYMYTDKKWHGQDPTTVVRSKTTFGAPFKWRNKARVFACSWADFFIEDADHWRDEAWDIIRDTQHLTYQLLTKRPENIKDRLPHDWPLPNVWLGVTAENQEMADKRIPLLLNLPAAKRFVSIEPMLGPVDLLKNEFVSEAWNTGIVTDRPCLDWVICGGETGGGARYMEPEWALSLKEQCAATKTAFFMKQMTKKAPMPENLQGQEFPKELKQEANMQTLSIDLLDILYHPRKQLGDLTSLAISIVNEGLRQPLVIFRMGEHHYFIIDGVRRFEVAKVLGWKNIPCVIQDVNEQRAAHLSYALNTERNTLNPIEEANHIEVMHGVYGLSYRALQMKGYGALGAIHNKRSLLSLPESVQDKVQEGKVQATHGYLLAKIPDPILQEKLAEEIVDYGMSVNKLDRRIKKLAADNKQVKEAEPVIVPEGEIPNGYLKDSRDMGEQANESIPMILTSTPYNVGKKYEVGVSFVDHLEQLNDVLKECGRVLIPGGVMAINFMDIWYFNDGQNQTHLKLMGHHFQTMLEASNIFLTDIIIWQKHNPWRVRPNVTYHEKTVHTSYRILDNYEYVYIFRKAGERQLPEPGIELKSRLTKDEWKEWVQGVWKIYPVNGQNLKGHPAVFPEELCNRLIRMYSFEGDKILDPFAGSFTAIKCANNLNRIGIGYERDLEHKQAIMDKLGLLPVVKTEPASMVEYAKLTAPTIVPAMALPTQQPEFFTNAPKKADTIQDLDKAA